MSDGCTDAERMCNSHKKLGGPAYCERCGKYHPVLPFCPEGRVPEGVKVTSMDNLSDTERFLKQMKFIMEKMAVAPDPDFQKTVDKKFWELV